MSNPAMDVDEEGAMSSSTTALPANLLGNDDQEYRAAVMQLDNDIDDVQAVS